MWTLLLSSNHFQDKFTKLLEIEDRIVDGLREGLILASRVSELLEDILLFITRPNIIANEIELSFIIILLLHYFLNLKKKVLSVIVVLWCEWDKNLAMAIWSDFFFKFPKHSY